MRRRRVRREKQQRKNTKNDRKEDKMRREGSVKRVQERKEITDI